MAMKYHPPASSFLTNPFSEFYILRCTFNKPSIKENFVHTSLYRNKIFQKSIVFVVFNKDILAKNFSTKPFKGDIHN